MELIKENERNNMIQCFVNYKLIINCKTKEDARDFFICLAKKNKINKDNISMHINSWNRYREKTCYKYISKNNMFYGKEEDYKNKNIEIKEWKKR